MLSQQIAFFATKYYINGNITHKNNGLLLIKKFKDNHDYLINEKLSNELYNSYFKNLNTDKMVKTYILNSTNFFTKSNEKNYIYILENSEILLLKLNRIVIQFQKRGEENREKLIKIASLILFLTIIILILEAKYIFTPIQKENQKHTESLKMLNKLLEAKVKLKTEEITHLLESVGQHVIISKTNDLGIVTYCSDAFCNKTGLSKEKLLGYEHPIFTTQKINKSELFAIKDRTFAKIIKNRTIDGADNWLDVKIISIYGIKNKIKEYLFVCYDKLKK